MMDEWSRRCGSLTDSLARSASIARRAGVGRGATVAELSAEAAHSLLDIEESAKALGGGLIARLEECDPETEAFEELLHEIGEELRHIYYHIANTALFEHLIEPGPEPTCPESP